MENKLGYIVQQLYDGGNNNDAQFPVVNSCDVITLSLEVKLSLFMLIWLKYHVKVNKFNFSTGFTKNIIVSYIF